MLGNRIALTAVIAASTLISAPARGELFRDLATGLQLFNYRFVGERNILGDGLDITAFANYNNEEFNFGLAQLTLNGQVFATGGFTRRVLPEFHFSLNTGGDGNVQPLAYNWEFNNGIQDLTMTGQVAVNVDTSINMLGFYDQTFQISNRGSYETDGFALIDEGTLDFDVGPVNLSGNVFLDILAAASEPFFEGSDLTNPFSKLTGRATKVAELTKITDDLQSRIAAGEILTDEELGTLINYSVLTAMIEGKSIDQALANLTLPEGLRSEDGNWNFTVTEVTTTPEPSAILLAFLTLPLLRRRRV